MAPEYEFTTTNLQLKSRFTDSSALGAAHFKTSLEFAFTEFPYYDAFTVVSDVFRLALELKKPPVTAPAPAASPLSDEVK